MTSDDLGRYRQVYAALMLLTLPTFAWAAGYPDSVFTPPPGPLSIFNGFPAAWVLVGLELALAVSLAALLVGAWIRIASVAATAAMILGYGFTFSLGKIDHMVLAMLAPVFLLAAGWGRDRSSPWVMRLWGWTIALAMLSAGLGKLLGGWLDPTTHATRSHMVTYDLWDRGGFLTGPLLSIDSAWLWEPLDVAAVVIECSLVLLVWNWRAFRAGLALLAMFHVGVFALFGIVYFWNIIVYAAFVPWGRLHHLPRVVPRWVLAPLAVAAWGLAQLDMSARLLGPAIVVAGGGVGAYYLLTQVMRVRSTSRAQSPLTVR